VEERVKKAPQSEHEGHDTFIFSEDYASIEEGDLVIDNLRGESKEDRMLAKSYSEYEQIDLSGGR